MHKKIALVLALGYTLSLTILSLMSVSDVPKLGSSFDDKIYHFGAYALLTILWYAVFYSTTWKFKILISSGIAFIYGIIIEVCQGVFTTYRTEDIADVLANSLGIVVGVVLIVISSKLKLK